MEDLHECFVCVTSSPIFLSPCLCKGRYIHEECLRRLVITQTKPVCMVCRMPYDNVQVRTPHYVSTKVAFCIYSASLLCINLMHVQDIAYLQLVAFHPIRHEESSNNTWTCVIHTCGIYGIWNVYPFANDRRTRDYYALVGK